MRNRLKRKNIADKRKKREEENRLKNMKKIYIYIQKKIERWIRGRGEKEKKKNSIIE